MPRVLIVEDSATQARQLADTLADAGFDTDVAPDAETGYARLAVGRFDLVLSDLMLPGDSGFDLCVRVKSTPAHRHLRVVVLTSQADPVNVLRGLQAGADGFMTKDCQPAEIAARLRHLLAREVRPPSAPPDAVRVSFLGREFDLAASRDQLLNVLLGAFEDVVSLNARYKQELTQRKRAEQALRDGARRYRSLVVATSQIVWSATADGAMAPDNPTWAAYTGQPADALARDGWLAAVHPDDRDRVAADWARAVATGCLYETEYRLRRHDGEYRHFAARGVPVVEGDDWTATYWQNPRFAAGGASLVPAGGRVREWVGACTDVTDRTRAADDLRRARDAAEAANRAKSDFLANMSHEIRTPMNGVLGMTALALRTDLTPEQREYLTMARASADSLLTVINDILDFSKVEAGMMTLEATPFGLREAVADAVRAVAVRAAEKGVELAVRVAPGVPDAVIGDPTRLKQVFVNLVGNGVKFTSIGEVVVRIEAETVTADQVVLHAVVTDTGPGVPADKLDAIFRPFEQADTSTTRKFGGTGLGLTICARLVGLMGGRVWAENVPAGGAAFHFLARLRLDPDPPPAPAAPDLAGVPVLVADDNATHRLILTEQFAEWGLVPTVAAGGAEALDHFRRAAAAGTPFRLAVLDAVMPDLDGTGVIEQVRADPSGFGSPGVVVLSAALDSALPARCRELGVARVLTKPAKPADLRAALSAALAGGKPGERGPVPATPEPTAVRPLRVLLAEDNPVNQLLAVTILKRWGHDVRVVGDGRAALDALAQSAFDVVLMDVQMPGMDGLEATRELRAGEAAAGPDGRRTPVIAMTAHALKGDRERCLDAGMDGYVSKPIDETALAAELAAVVRPPEEPAARPDPVFDAAAFIASVGGDWDLVSQVRAVFLNLYPARLADLRAAVAAGDDDRFRRTVRALRGATAALRAKATTDLLHKLETGGPAAAAGVLGELDPAFAALRAALEALGPT